MDRETFYKHARVLIDIGATPVPAHPSEEKFSEVKDILDALKATNHVEIGITQGEFAGAILMAESVMLDFVHAKG
jgi:hypothetical protein